MVVLQDYGDGELLKPPPPKNAPLRFIDDSGSEDGRVKMSDGSVKYDAYSGGEWDPYPSAYVV